MKFLRYILVALFALLPVIAHASAVNEGMKAVVPQAMATKAYGLFSAATSSGAAVTLVTLNAQKRSAKIMNLTDKPIVVMFGAVEVDYLEAGATQTYDPGANRVWIESGVVIKAYIDGSAPTSGAVRVCNIW